MKDYSIDFINGVVTLFPSFLRKASSIGTQEYNTMLELRRNHPEFKFKKADAPKQKTTNKDKNLTYANMELFIRNSFDSEKSNNLLEDMIRVKALSKIQANPYKYVHDWFLKQCPNYNYVEVACNSEEKTQLKRLPHNKRKPRIEKPI